MIIKDIESLHRKFGFNSKVRSNNELGFDCPKCGPGTNKFHLGVNLSKKVWNCFKCGYKGAYGANIKLIKKPIIQKSEITGRIKGFKKLSDSDESLIKYLNNRGVDLKRARSLFWGKSSDRRYVGRIVIPIIEDGEIVYFVARSVEAGELKEISPKKEEGWMQRKEVVYGLDNCRKTEGIIVVEGIFDCECLINLGFNSVSILGSHISDVQIGKILSKNPTSISIMFDGDEAGRKGSKDAYSKITKRWRGKTQIVSMEEGKDPDELTKEEIDCLMKGGD